MLDLIRSITKKEWLLVFGLSFLVIVITTLPLVYGWLISPDNSVFTGIHFYNLNDWIVYYSYLEQIKDGNFLFRDLFTSESAALVFNPFWLAAGLIGRVFKLSNIVTLNLARILLIPIFYFVAYLFLAYLFSDIKKRKISLLLLSFSSGLGFLLFFQIMRYPNNFAFGRFNWPMDIWVPEQNTFLTLYYSPHFIASLTLILLIFLLTTMFAARQKISYAIYAGLAGLLLFFFHPFHVLTVFCVILVYFAVLVFKDKKYFWPLVKYYFIFFILSLPAIVYYLYLLNFDFVVKQKSLQNICPTTSLWLTLFSYGLLLVFSVVGFFKLAGKTKKFYLMDNNFLFILVWAAVGLILIYSPVAYQRRLTQGLHFPFVVLTTVGLFFCYEALLTKKNNLLKHLFKQRYTILFLLSVLFIGSNVFNLAIDLSIYRDRRAISYLNNNLVQAMEWLKSTSPDSIIFNSADNQVNVVPAYSGRTVYVGHGVETVDFFEKQKEVDWFFANNRPAESERNFLLERGVDYIFYSGLEKKLGSYNPDTKEYLKNVYSNGSASIYKVL